MATLYTKEDRAAALASLRIAPVKGKVTAEEAARILSWRAKEERGIDFTYKVDAVRQHVRYGHFIGLEPGGRGSKYPVEQVFALPLSPQRAIPRKQRT